MVSSGGTPRPLGLLYVLGVKTCTRVQLGTSKSHFKQPESAAKVAQGRGRKVLDQMWRHNSAVGGASSMYRGDDGCMVGLAVRPAWSDSPFPYGGGRDGEGIKLSGAPEMLLGGPVSWTQEFTAH